MDAGGTLFVTFTKNQTEKGIQLEKLDGCHAKEMKK